MTVSYEVVMGYKGLPFRVFVHSVDKMDTHWHDNLELLFMLKSSVEVMIRDKKYLVKRNEMFLVNSREVHSITGKDRYHICLSCFCVIIKFKIHLLNTIQVKE